MYHWVEDKDYTPFIPFKHKEKKKAEKEAREERLQKAKDKKTDKTADEEEPQNIDDGKQYVTIDAKSMD